MTNEEKLKVMSGQLEKMQEQNRRLLATKQQTQDSLDAIESQRQATLRAHAAGDSKAAGRLDDLEGSEKGFRRQLQGTEMLIAESNAEIEQRNVERAPILVQVQRAAYLKKADELTVAAETDFDRLEALMEETASALFQCRIQANRVSDFCTGNADGVDSLNRITLRVDRLAQRMRLKIANERWMPPPPGQLFIPRELTIQACVPPADANKNKAA